MSELAQLSLCHSPKQDPCDNSSDLLMLQKAGADAATTAAAAGDDQGSGGTGIILRRQAKPVSAGASGGSSKPGDLAALADTVQKLCQVALPLARSMEFLHEDVDSMGKEFR